MSSGVFRWGPWTFERTEWRLSHRESGPVLLPNKTLELLALFLDCAPSLVEKGEILARVWSGATVEEGNIAFHVASLRRVLDAEGEPSCIETVRARGYRFVAPLVAIAPQVQASSAPPSEAVALPSRPQQVADVQTPRQIWRAAFLIGAVAILAGWGAVWLVSRTPETATRGTTNAEAYDLVVQAREQWRQRTPAAVAQAIALYEHAIRLDDRYARAYSGLADCYNLTMSGLLPDVRYPLAKQNAEKALALDPSSAEAHNSVAFLRYKFEWKWEEAEAEFKQALALDPSNSLAHHWYGELLHILGRDSESIAQLQKALELDPRSLAIRAEMVPPLIRAGQVAAARAGVEAGLKIDPNWSMFHLRMAEIYRAQGLEKESVESELQWMTLRGIPLERLVELRAAYRAGGRSEMLRARIRQNLEIVAAKPSAFLLATDLADDYGTLKQKEDALQWLTRAVERREDAVLRLATNTAYDSIRDDPRFKELMKRVGLKVPAVTAK